MDKRSPEAGLNPGPELLTPAEAADLARCSAKTIYRLVSAGELGAVRIGRLVRIPRIDLLDYLDRNHSPARW
jgi:excisionase family DNA binding protein